MPSPARIFLKNQTVKGRAAVGSYGTAAIVTTIPTAGVPAAQATFRSEATLGFWYVTLRRTSGPSATDYSYKLGPGDAVTEEDPPIGEIWALADGTANGVLAWYVNWSEV